MPWRGKPRLNANGARRLLRQKASTRPRRDWPAADIMGRHPMSLQLRYLQTLAEVAVENNSTIVFPIPIDLLKPFIEMDCTGPSA